MRNIHLEGNLQVKSLPKHQQNKQFDSSNNILLRALRHANVDHHFHVQSCRYPTSSAISSHVWNSTTEFWCRVTFMCLNTDRQCPHGKHCYRELINSLVSIMTLSEGRAWCPQAQVLSLTWHHEHIAISIFANMVLICWCLWCCKCTLPGEICESF